MFLKDNFQVNRAAWTGLLYSDLIGATGLRARDGAKRCVELLLLRIAVGDHLSRLRLSQFDGFKQLQHIAIRLTGIRLVDGKQVRVIQHANRAARAAA